MDEKIALYRRHFPIDSGVNFTLLNSSLDCSSWSKDDWRYVEYFVYWVGHIGVCSVAAMGLLVNFLGIGFLSRRLSNQNIFNELIVILLIIDSLYLLIQFGIKLVYLLSLESMNIESFGDLLNYVIIPVYIKPISHMFLTLSIFMTVGIACERSVAIKHPISHRQSMLSAKFRRISLMKYMIPIILCAVGFDLPKFFEQEVHWKKPKHLKNINASDYR